MKQIFFPWNSLAFSMIQQMLIRSSSAFLKSTLNIWKFSVHMLLKPSLKDFEHNITSMGDKCNRPVVWTFIKKAECRRIDAFELWCWRRLLRVPWTAQRSNQLILKEISPEYSLEGLILKLKLQYSGHLMRRTDSFEKTLMLERIEGRRRRGQQRMRWLDDITDSMDMSEQAPGVGDGQGSLACCSPRGHKELDMTERLNWTFVFFVYAFLWGKYL